MAGKEITMSLMATKSPAWQNRFLKPVLRAKEGVATFESLVCILYELEHWETLAIRFRSIISKFLDAPDFGIVTKRLL